jgi:hypothetical protein
MQAAGEQSPICSLLCPPPINIIVTSNTFVQFNCDGSVKDGLVLAVNPLQCMLHIHLFLTWKEVKDLIGLHLPQNESF